MIMLTGDGLRYKEFPKDLEDDIQKHEHSITENLGITIRETYANFVALNATDDTLDTVKYVLQDLIREYIYQLGREVYEKERTRLENID